MKERQESLLCLIVSKWPNQHLFTKQLLFSSSCELHSFPFKSNTCTPFSLVQNDIYTVLNCLWNCISMWIPNIHEIKLDFLLLICTSCQFDPQFSQKYLKRQSKCLPSPQLLAYCSSILS